MTEKKNPARGPFEWLWHVSVLIFGSVILLSLAWSFIQPALPWIIGGAIVAGLAWIGILLWKWRRDTW